MKLTANFSLSEFDCNDGTPVPNSLIPNVQKLAVQLQILRDYLQTTIVINSGYRTPKYNASLKGSAKNSQHLLGKAADIVASKYTPSQVHAAIDKLIKIRQMRNGGLGIYNTFVHYDIRDTPARWDLRT